MSYKPKKNHPWRQYRNRTSEPDDDKAPPKQNVRPLYEFLKDMVESWDTFSIHKDEFSSASKIKNMRDDKVAAWLADFLHRNYTRPKDYII